MIDASFRDYQAAHKYWKTLKRNLKKEGSELVKNGFQLSAAHELSTKRTRLKTRTGIELVNSLYRLTTSLTFKNSQVHDGIICLDRVPG